MSSFLSRIRIHLCKIGLTLEEELAIVPSVFVPSVDESLRSSEDKLTNPDTNEDRKSVPLSSGGGIIIRGACVKTC